MGLLEPIPQGILVLLKSIGISEDAVVVARKTALKPAYGIPTVWLIATREEFLLCSTHKTRGVWKKFNRDTVNAIRVEMSIMRQKFLRIIYRSLDESDLLIPLPSVFTDVDLDDLTRCLNTDS